MKKNKLFDEHKMYFFKAISIILFIIFIIILTVFVVFFIDYKIVDDDNEISNISSRSIIETDLNDGIIIGDKNVYTSIIIYNDYDSPYCKKFHKDIYLKLIEDYVHTNKAKIILKNIILGENHIEALNAINGLYCADEQRGAYQMHNLIYRHKKFDNNNLINHSKTIGLNQTEFQTCFLTQKYNDVIETSIKINQNITIVPTVIIGEEVIEGPKPYAVYQKAIENILPNQLNTN